MTNNICNFSKPKFSGNVANDALHRNRITRRLIKWFQAFKKIKIPRIFTRLISAICMTALSNTPSRLFLRISESLFELSTLALAIEEVHGSVLSRLAPEFIGTTTASAIVDLLAIEKKSKRFFFK